MCTPRKPEDVAAREHWQGIAFERHRRQAEVLRGYHDAWRARIAAGEFKTAMTRDQATAIGVAGDAPGQAMWAGTPEQEEQVRRENRKAREQLPPAVGG